MPVLKIINRVTYETYTKRPLFISDDSSLIARELQKSSPNVNTPSHFPNIHKSPYSYTPPKSVTIKLQCCNRFRTIGISSDEYLNSDLTCPYCDTSSNKSDFVIQLCPIHSRIPATKGRRKRKIIHDNDYKRNCPICTRKKNLLSIANSSQLLFIGHRLGNRISTIPGMMVRNNGGEADDYAKIFGRCRRRQ